MNKNAKIYVAGHTGLVGSAFVRYLVGNGYTNLVLRRHRELDLLKQSAVEIFFEVERPEYVINAAGLVGGIRANQEAPADFFYQNMEMAQNLIWNAYKYDVKKFLFLGSACMYPRDCEQPMKEDKLLTALPESSNEGYALAKICGSRLCTYLNKQFGTKFISMIPANTFGIGDSFDPERSHVIPALMLKYHNAKKNGDKEITIWGSGKAMREFIYVDDVASAGVFLLNHYSGNEPVNVGTGEEVSIMELSEKIRRITGFKGNIATSPEKEDGMIRRLCDSTKLYNMGWKANITLDQGLEQLYQWFLKNIEQ